MRKIIKAFLIVLFTIFSFYYTDKIVYLSRLNDPIMKKINSIKQDYNKDYTNAILTKDTMLVGSSGKRINEEKSYEKMKKVNTFNEKLLEYENVDPVINKENNLNKLIKGKNTDEKKIAFIFKLDNLDSLDQIIYILDKNNEKATFFFDGSLIEKNISYIKKILSDKYPVGFYGYNNKYDALSIKYINGLYKKNNIKSSNYCLKKNKDFLTSCIYSKKSTIDPVIIKSNLYNYIKYKKEKGYIYQVEDNSFNLKELNSAIIYLKNKGYSIETLDELLKE